MKKLLTFVAFGTTLGFAGFIYTGPRDNRMTPDDSLRNTLGWFAQFMNVGALAEIIEDGPENSPGFPNGYIKVRVVNPIYGCTNGQELVIVKRNPQKDYMQAPSLYDPSFEYYPTNHNKRIVFAGITSLSGNCFYWTPDEWALPPKPEIFVPQNRSVRLEGYTRGWWYEDYQGGLPYTHLTNLVQAARRDRNWTNFFHIVRDGVPSPSNRVWEDSFGDILMLYLNATEEQFMFMYKDPLLDAESRSNMKLDPCVYKDGKVIRLTLDD